MNSPHQPLPASQNPTLALGDIYYILFRHKWKILLCSVAGVATAFAVFKLRAPLYQSEAKLFVRYVITQSKTIGPSAEGTQTKSPDQGGDTIMNSEMEILTSMDLAEQVARTVGPEKILPAAKGAPDVTKAAIAIHQNLVVGVPPRSSVIDVVFHHPDKTVVQPVLAAVIDAYLKKHVEIHRAVGLVGDFLIQETDQLRSRLAQTEDELRKARNKAGVISLDDSKKAFSDQIAKIRQELFDTQADLAEHSAILQEITKNSPAAVASDANPEVPSERMDEFKSLNVRLEVLRKREQELLTQFTEENALVKEVRAQLAEAQNRFKALVAQYPTLARASVATPAPAGVQAGAIDPAAEVARIAALQAKIKVLNSQMDEVQAEAAKADQMEGSIQELRRRQSLEEANYKYYAAALDESRINEAIGPDRVSNISQIQTPSPPFRDWSKVLKMMMGLAVGGGAAGLAWAFSIELYFDRSVRRPADLERLVRVPLFLSIPDLGRNGSRLALGPGRLALPAARAGKGQGAKGKGQESGDLNAKPETTTAQAATAAALVPRDGSNALYAFYETLRDRLMGYFENKNLVHKPKLVAITGIGRESGVTTIAAGLARCFSETGEGNVLLVDMTVDQGTAQQYYKGKAVHGLEEVLDGKEPAQVQENLYVVAEGSNSEKLTRILPRRFNQLVPKMRASDFEYIIFDMPPVSQISITPRLAGYMDMTLMVVESEKTDRDLVQRATTMLEDAKANVGVVLNKTKAYVPSKLQKDFLGRPDV